jgi:hypothetical protein
MRIKKLCYQSIDGAVVSKRAITATTIKRKAKAAHPIQYESVICARGGESVEMVNAFKMMIWSQ